jgi:hypothetical protein
LTEENYRYLVHNALQVILQRTDTWVIIKPHPREDKERLKALLAEFPSDRWMLVELSTLALASICAVNVSFWSSAVLDSIAVGTPAIEFHRFHRPIPQSMHDSEGAIVSIYTRLGLAIRTNDPVTLAQALDSALMNQAALLATQRQALTTCFPDNEAQIAHLREILRRLLSAKSEHGKVSWGILYKLISTIVRMGDSLQDINAKHAASL